jgi:hypothetical protein
MPSDILASHRLVTIAPRRWTAESFDEISTSSCFLALLAERVLPEMRALPDELPRLLDALLTPRRQTAGMIVSYARDTISHQQRDTTERTGPLQRSR